MDKIAEIKSEVTQLIGDISSTTCTYTQILDELLDLVQSSTLQPCVHKDVEDTIRFIEDEIRRVNNAMQFYILESSACPPNPKKHMSIARKYCPIKTRASAPRQLRIMCSLCKNDSFDIVNDTTHICRNCGNQKDVFNISPSHKDTSRVNTAVRYTYKRKIHFKDCINQYQGKQNANISDKVISDLRDRISLHELCDNDDYSRVTKEHILMFLKDAGHTKHYEDATLIYKIITGNPVDDIGYLEDALIHDFNLLTDMYDKKFKRTARIPRKSFINTQYVLFQLLKRHKHPCRSTDFNILKTVDRKSLHEEIISELFNDLGWNFTSLF